MEHYTFNARGITLDHTSSSAHFLLICTLIFRLDCISESYGSPLSKGHDWMNACWHTHKNPEAFLTFNVTNAQDRVIFRPHPKQQASCALWSHKQWNIDHLFSLYWVLCVRICGWYRDTDGSKHHVCNAWPGNFTTCTATGITAYRDNGDIKDNSLQHTHNIHLNASSFRKLNLNNLFCIPCYFNARIIMRKLKEKIKINYI